MEIDEDVKEFLIEGYEHLNQLESDLVVLEQSNSDPEVMNRIYRNLHTIKGNSGFLGLENLQILTHAAENLLSRLRDRTIIVNTDITNTLLLVADAVREHFESLANIGEENKAEHTALLARLSQLQTQENGQTNKKKSLSQVPTFPIPTDSDFNPFNIADSSIRVDVNLLDKLMNLVGELVLCRNQILELANVQLINDENDDAFKSASGRLNQVTSELQEGVMKTRMQPIGTIWSKFPRVVRDMAMTLGKQVQLEMEGEETELDKTLIEAIANPLTHIVRNCLDHGLETPEERIIGGKSAVGRLWLRAYHESGHVNIEIADDGKGINPEYIKQKALQRGMLAPEGATKMSVQEAINLIFLPSFSTAETVTNLSGRGVGMDVVRTNIEKISGTIDVQSRVGEGTIFKLKIPLTLAIIPTLIITSGGNRFAIPQVNLLELVRLEKEQAQQSIEMFHGVPVYRLRGRLLPLVYLNRELQLDKTNPSQQSELQTEDINIVVVQATDKPFGLVVDAINDTQEIVVKPLGKTLKSISCFAGATIMGDGKVALILDIQGLAKKTHIAPETEKKKRLTEEHQQPSEEPQQLLLFQGPKHQRMAIPLANVSRLEEVSPSLLERVGKQDVIQYRNQIMRLVYLSSVFCYDSTQANSLSHNLVDELEDTEDKLSVIVVSTDGEKKVGLIVEQVLDIVEQVIEIKGEPTQEGIQCCAVIQGQVTEIIDVEAVISNNLFAASRILVEA